jgi:hypothetical protein
VLVLAAALQMQIRQSSRANGSGNAVGDEDGPVGTLQASLVCQPIARHLRVGLALIYEVRSGGPNQLLLDGLQNACWLLGVSRICKQQR